LPEEIIGNRFLLEDLFTQQQLKLMVLCGFGVVMVLPEDLVLIMAAHYQLQSPLFPEEILGNRFPVEKRTQQRLKLMVLCGFGGVVLTEDLELMILRREILQSPPLPEEMIGNRLLVDFFIRQQSKPMVVSGLGVMVWMEFLEQMILQAEVLQLQHLPEETPGNKFQEHLPFTSQQSKQMVLYGLGDEIIGGNLEPEMM